MFRLRDFQPDDAPKLLALFKDTIRRVNCRDYCPAQIAAWATDELTLEAWSSKFPGRRTFIAETASSNTPRIAGFGDLEPDGHLDRFFVAADHQGQGVGRMLLAAIIAHARALKVPRIRTEASITARPFFARCGFREVTNQLVFYRGAAFLNYRMELPLDEPGILSAG
ncbi:GNAT family N-acetyltransferase [Anatilimnocola sp. NA78]|uniref:GNAT family N-acetyltransferase n=1 Tax=Anatilimnocola sp. NA78 TaxID=3415683 RepID=UPI003CE501DF